MTLSEKRGLEVEENSQGACQGNEQENEIKTEDDAGESTTEAGERAPNDPSITPDKEEPDYHLVSKHHTPQAFGIFAGWLYNDSPSTPVTSSDCKFLLQAYILAVKYGASPASIVE